MTWNLSPRCWVRDASAHPHHPLAFLFGRPAIEQQWERDWTVARAARPDQVRSSTHTKAKCLLWAVHVRHRVYGNEREAKNYSSW